MGSRLPLALIISSACCVTRALPGVMYSGFPLLSCWWKWTGASLAPPSEEEKPRMSKGWKPPAVRAAAAAASNFTCDGVHPWYRSEFLSDMGLLSLLSVPVERAGAHEGAAPWRGGVPAGLPGLFGWRSMLLCMLAAESRLERCWSLRARLKLK